jgi:hypothetical protein
VKLDQVIPALRKTSKIQLSIAVYPEIVSSSKIYFCQSLSCSYLLSLYKSKIYYSFLISQVFCPLYEDIPLDIAQTGIAVAVVLLASIRKRNKDDKTADEN